MFKEELEEVAFSNAWKKSTTTMTDVDWTRRDCFLGRNGWIRENMQFKKHNRYLQDSFLAQLPNSLAEGKRGSDENYAGGGAGPGTAVNLKRLLLHLVSAESLIHKCLYGQFTVVRRVIHFSKKMVAGDSHKFCLLSEVAPVSCV